MVLAVSGSMRQFATLPGVMTTDIGRQGRPVVRGDNMLEMLQHAVLRAVFCVGYYGSVMIETLRDQHS